MNEAKTFTLKTINDIVKVVTNDNIDNLLKDFEGCLRLFLLAKDMSDVNLDLPSILWTDDGKHDITLELIDTVGYIVFITIEGKELDNFYIEATDHFSAQIIGLEKAVEYCKQRGINSKPKVQSIRL